MNINRTAINLNKSRTLNGRGLLSDLRILVAEDNKMNQYLATEYLQKNGAGVHVVSNGMECLRILDNEKFDVILMDLQMPVMGGMEATINIRKSENTIPIIACTGETEEREQIRCLEIGMNGRITKPYDEGSMLEEILRLMNKSSDFHSVQSLADIYKEDLELKKSVQHVLEKHGPILGANLFRIFIDTVPSELKLLRQAYANNDTEELLEEIHKIAGTLCVFNFNETGKEAIRLEKLIMEKKFAEFELSFHPFIHTVEQILIEIQEYLPKLK